MDSPLFDPAEAAVYLHTSKARLFDLIRNGELDSFKPSPQVRLITRESCDAWIERQLEAQRASDGGAAA